MMGVYIKGMEMPKSCSDCSFFVDVLYDANDELCSACLAKEDNPPWGCGYEEIDGIDHMARRMDYCPLVEVQEPHGRLVDADVLMNVYIKNEFCSDMGDAMEVLNNFPTVIEAEGEND